MRFVPSRASELYELGLGCCCCCDAGEGEGEPVLLRGGPGQDGVEDGRGGETSRARPCRPVKPLETTCSP